MRFFSWHPLLIFFAALGVVILALVNVQSYFLMRDYNFYLGIGIIFISNFVSLLLIFVGLLLFKYQTRINENIAAKVGQFEKELLHLAYYDKLTNLPNRTMLIDKLNSFIAEAKINPHSIAILIINIDNFKTIIDSHGHDFSQHLLIEFSNRLSEKNYFIARLEADEFVILVDGVKSLLTIANAAQSVLDITHEPLIIDDYKIFITVSIGIAVFPNNGVDSNTLLKNADIAVFHAKELGKNNYQFCTPEMTIQAEERALLEVDLYQAIANNEFIIFYQPKISLKNGKISGVEALIRWDRPEHGMINPSEFITLAESNGLIVPIGVFMLRAACIQGKKWHDAGLPISISINVSIRQMVSSDFIASIEHILHETHFDPRYLEFEITETIFMEHSSNNIAVLTALKAMGSKITIDDFGTGYSSLSYLTKFSIDNIKLDKSFIHQISESTKQKSIVSAIIIMAHSLGIEVIAEGVEHPFQLEFLKDSGCDEVQGYFYSQPLSAGEIARLFSYSQTL